MLCPSSFRDRTPVARPVMISRAIAKHIPDFVGMYSPMPPSRSRSNLKNLRIQSSKNPLNLPSKGDNVNLVKTVSVKKSEPVLVRPILTNCSGLYYLSRIDQNLMRPLELLYSYKVDEMRSTDNVCEVVKNSLAQALVYFYPLAGKLSMSETGDFVVSCTGEGVYFVEAVAAHDLDQLGDISKPDETKLRSLLHIHEAKDILDMPLLTVQVTTFNCGGFVIGLRANHCMMDGVSVCSFMNSWAEIARGLPLSVPPFLDRSILKPGLLQTELPEHILSNIADLLTKRYSSKKTNVSQDEENVNASVNFGPENLVRLKKQVIKEGINRLPTNFELVTAFLWREIIRSRKVEQSQHTQIWLPINARTKYDTSFPKGYFGNCLGFAYIGSNTEDQLVTSSLSSIVEQVHKAIQMVTTDYLQAILCYAEAVGSNIPFENIGNFFENVLIFSDLTRLPVYKADFGWGDPEQFGFLSVSENVIFFPPQKKVDRNNVTALLSLPASAMKTFRESVTALQ